MPQNRADATNQHYGGLDIQGDNIVFVNAQEDPWQWAGMRYISPKDERSSSMTAYMVNCADCGHCIDLQAPREDQPRELTDV